MTTPPFKKGDLLTWCLHGSAHRCFYAAEDPRWGRSPDYPYEAGWLYGCRPVEGAMRPVTSEDLDRWVRNLQKEYLKARRKLDEACAMALRVARS